MKTTTNSRQTFPHASSKEENSQNKRAPAEGTVTYYFFQSADRSWVLIGCIEQGGPLSE